MRGLYIHVPFCKKKCPYCDFYSVTDLSLIQSYLSSLKREMGCYKKKVDTVYMGGGTPSLLEEKICDILEWVKKRFLWERGECTVEGNPESLSKDLMRLWKKCGVNRISIGVQSFDKCDLAFLGRIHSPDDARKAIDDALSVFENVSVDVITGLPHHTPGDVLKTLKEIVRYGVQHISVYMLTIEDGTEFGERVRKGELVPLSEEREREIFVEVCDFLEGEGYRHYEVSNFALPGYECRHNLNYWLLGEYIGLGPSAHSFTGSIRYANLPSLERYLRGEYQGFLEEVGEKRREEFLMLGLRLTSGVPLRDFEVLFGSLAPLEDMLGKYLEVKNSRLRLTRSGMLLLNQVVVEILRRYEG